jgi:hypothetical protein
MLRSRPIVACCLSRLACCVNARAYLLCVLSIAPNCHSRYTYVRFHSLSILPSSARVHVLAACCWLLASAEELPSNVFCCVVAASVCPWCFCCGCCVRLSVCVCMLRICPIRALSLVMVLRTYCVLACLRVLVAANVCPCVFTIVYYVLRVPVCAVM